MKLIRLKITDPNGFRSLQPGFEYHFRTEWDLSEVDEFAPFICAGRNGSGKSNLLEALAAIFFHLDCKGLENRPELFEFNEETAPDGYREEVCSPDAFELEFFGKPCLGFGELIKEPYPHVLVKKEIGKGPEYYILNGVAVDCLVPLDSQAIKQLLPDYIVAYSSGENEILSLPFFKMRFINFDEYADALRNELPYYCPPDGKPEGRLAFFDQDFNQAIMLSNFILAKDEALAPFRIDIGLERIHHFRIVINEVMYPAPFISMMKMSKSGENVMVPPDQKLLLENCQAIITKLEHCATTHFLDDDDTLYLDFWLDEACKAAFRLHFGDSLRLFQSFQLLLTLNLYSVSEAQKREMYHSNSLYFNETIPILPSDQRVIRFKDVVLQKRGVKGTVYCKSLSDGENQFLHTLGLCTLYREKSVLFLLDEPETHFNPDWRSKFISRLRECFPESDKFREMIITTHTPFLISDSRPEKVLIFNKDEDTGLVTIKKPDYNTLGASINKITMSTFDKRVTIGGYAESILNELRKRFEAGHDPEQLIDEINSKLGDSVEKMLLIKAILDRMEEVTN